MNQFEQEICLFYFIVCKSKEIKTNQNKVLWNTLDKEGSPGVRLCS